MIVLDKFGSGKIALGSFGFGNLEWGRPELLGK